MPDITLCINDLCPMQNNCKRHQKMGYPSSEYQSYSYFNEENRQECDYQIPIKEDNTKIGFQIDKRRDTR